MHEHIWKFFDGPDQKTPSNNHALTFEKFPELPLELRRMVWKEVCLEGRVIDVWGIPVSYPSETNPSYSGNHIRKFGSYNPVPPILHVSREARKVGLKHHELSFAVTQPLERSPTLLKCQPQIYVNFDNDIPCPIFSDPVKDYCYQFVAALLSSKIPIGHITLPAYPAAMIRWNCSDFQGLTELQEIFLYPAMTKVSEERPFYPAYCAPFSPRLLSRDEAEEKGLVDHTGKYNTTEVLLDAKEMVHDLEYAKGWGSGHCDDDDDYTPSNTAINLMYLHLEPSKK